MYLKIDNVHNIDNIENDIDNLKFLDKPRNIWVFYSLKWFNIVILYLIYRCSESACTPRSTPKQNVREEIERKLEQYSQVIITKFLQKFQGV